MAQAPEREYAEAGKILFSLESLELTGEDRLEVSGRWFGVRGRRFVRPTLTILGDGRNSRFLADLEHKPWSAEDGEAWTAAFPVELGGQRARELELAVAPDIAVALPLPSPLAGDGDGADEAKGNGTGAREVADQKLRPATSAAVPRGIPAGHELDVLRKRLEEQRRHVAQLHAELERAGVTKAEMTSALTRRDAAVRKFDAVVRERDEAQSAREDAVRDRDDAMRRRDRMTGALDEAIARSELAVHEADEARRERDGALRERQSMVKALNRLRAERDEAVARRNAALKRIGNVQDAANAQLAQLR
jgi:hypothetical protein